MSFIPKNPLSVPEIERTPSTPPGTRGLFAKKDGWYDVDDNGTEKKLAFYDDVAEDFGELTFDGLIDEYWSRSKMDSLKEAGVYKLRDEVLGSEYSAILVVRKGNAAVTQPDGSLKYANVFQILIEGGDVSSRFWDVDENKWSSWRYVFTEIDKKANKTEIPKKLSTLLDDITDQTYNEKSEKPQSGKAVAEAIMNAAGSGGGGLTEEEVVEIIRANAQRYVNGDTTLPPTTQAMVDYVNSYCSVYGEDITTLRTELETKYLMTSALDDQLAYSNAYINHSMMIAELDQTNSAIIDDLVSIHDEMGSIESIAKGRATGYVFDTVDDMNAWLSDSNNVAKLILGDNLYIRATDVPDYWWDGAQAQELETQKVDLTEYVKNTDYATSKKSGVVRAGDNNNSASGIYSDNGYLMIAHATTDVISAKKSYNRPITPVFLEHAVTVCTNQDSEAELTEAQLKLPPSTQYLKDVVGDIDTALDAILAIHNEMIGGDGE